MIVQDSMGHYHDVPARPVYDGLGNPVGGLFDFIPGLGPILNAVTSPITSMIPGMSQPAAPAAPVATPVTVAPPPAYATAVQPPGWVQPTYPYTGMRPMTRYLRCSVWPGPPGMVPSYAPNMPGMPQPGYPGYPGYPPGFAPSFPGGGGGGYHHRHHRRRR